MKGEPSFTVSGMANWSRYLWKSIWKILKKLKINLPYDPATPLGDILPKDSESYSTDTCSARFIATLFILARKWRQHKCSLTDEWIMKMWYIQTVEYHPAGR